MADPATFLANNDALIAYNKDSRDKGKQTSAPTERKNDSTINIYDSGMVGNVNHNLRD